MQINNLVQASLSDKRFAINGGNRVRKTLMPSRVALGRSERSAIAECLEYYDNLGLDPGYSGFFREKYAAAFVKRMKCFGYALPVSSGTAALYIAIKSLKLKPGSEVLVSPIADSGTYSAIILNNLVPKLVDIQMGHWNSGPEEFYNRITETSSAVLLVHFGGYAANSAEVGKLCRERGLAFIEDCSQSHFATNGGVPVGTHGDISVFSTMYRKIHITGGTGGVIFTKDLELYRLCQAHADRGKAPWIKEFSDRHPSTFLFPALNFNNSEFGCAIGVKSLGRVGRVISNRRIKLSYLSGLMSDLKLFRPGLVHDGDSPFLYPVELSKDIDTRTKIALAEILIEEGIPLNPHYDYVAYDWPWIREYLADTYSTPLAREKRDRSLLVYINERYDKSAIQSISYAFHKVEEIVLEKLS